MINRWTTSCVGRDWKRPSCILGKDTARIKMDIYHSRGIFFLFFYFFFIFCHLLAISLLLQQLQMTNFIPFFRTIRTWTDHGTSYIHVGRASGWSCFFKVILPWLIKDWQLNYILFHGYQWLAKYSVWEFLLNCSIIVIKYGN